MAFKSFKKKKPDKDLGNMLVESKNIEKPLFMDAKKPVMVKHGTPAKHYLYPQKPAIQTQQNQHIVDPLPVQGQRVKYNMNDFLESVKLDLSSSAMTTLNNGHTQSLATEKDFSTTEILGQLEIEQHLSADANVTNMSSTPPSTEVVVQQSNSHISPSNTSPNVSRLLSSNSFTITPSKRCSVKMSDKTAIPNKNNSNFRGQHALLNECLTVSSYENPKTLTEDVHSDDGFLLLKQLTPLKNGNQRIGVPHCKFKPEIWHKNETSENHAYLKNRFLTQWRTEEVLKQYERKSRVYSRSVSRDKMTDARNSESGRVRTTSRCKCCYGGFFPSSICSAHSIRSQSSTQPYLLDTLTAWDMSPADIIKRAVNDALHAEQLQLSQRTKKKEPVTKTSTSVAKLLDSKNCPRERQKKRR